MLMSQLVSLMATIDDLNYPEKTETYYIVNAPIIFSACWKVYTLACHQKLLLALTNLHTHDIEHFIHPF